MVLFVLFVPFVFERLKTTNRPNLTNVVLFVPFVSFVFERLKDHESTESDECDAIRVIRAIRVQK